MVEIGDFYNIKMIFKGLDILFEKTQKLKLSIKSQGKRPKAAPKIIIKFNKNKR